MAPPLFVGLRRSWSALKAMASCMKSLRLPPHNWLLSIESFSKPFVSDSTPPSNLPSGHHLEAPCRGGAKTPDECHGYFFVTMFGAQTTGQPSWLPSARSPSASAAPLLPTPPWLDNPVKFTGDRQAGQSCDPRRGSKIWLCVLCAHRSV